MISQTRMRRGESLSGFAPAVILPRYRSNTFRYSSAIRSSSALTWSATSESSSKVNWPWLAMHIVKVATVCWYHLWRLRQLCSYVDRDVMARLVLSLSSLALTTATPYSPAYRHHRRHHCNEYRMRLHGWYRVLTDEHTSRLRWSDCTACRSSTESCSSYSGTDALLSTSLLSGISDGHRHI